MPDLTQVTSLLHDSWFTKQIAELAPFDWTEILVTIANGIDPANFIEFDQKTPDPHQDR